MKNISNEQINSYLVDQDFLAEFLLHESAASISKDLEIKKVIGTKNGDNIIPRREKFCSFIATGPGSENNRQEFVENYIFHVRLKFEKKYACH